MLVAVLCRNTYRGARDFMFCEPEQAVENKIEGISKPRILTKRQFFNHHYPKIKHLPGVKKFCKELYKVE